MIRVAASPVVHATADDEVGGDDRSQRAQWLLAHRWLLQAWSLLLLRLLLLLSWHLVLLCGAAVEVLGAACRPVGVKDGRCVQI